jgi:hypothetical protein
MNFKRDRGSKWVFASIAGSLRTQRRRSASMITFFPEKPDRAKLGEKRLAKNGGYYPA